MEELTNDLTILNDKYTASLEQIGLLMAKHNEVQKQKDQQIALLEEQVSCQKKRIALLKDRNDCSERRYQVLIQGWAAMYQQ